MNKNPLDPDSASKKGRSCRFFIKTQLCEDHHKMGSCRKGEKCTFAHGKEELREPPPPSPKWRSGITEEEEERSSGNWDVEDDPKLVEDQMKQSSSPPSTSKAFQEHWTCTARNCKATNDGRLNSYNCYRCGRYKVGLKKWNMTKGTPRWICPRNGCEYDNFDNRMKCRKCNTPKPG